MTLQEIADELGLSLKQMRDWSYRHNCEKRNTIKGIMPKPKGRPRKDGQPSKQDAEKELQRLRMENKLLRDFLRVNRKDVRPKAKYAVIYRHRNEYPVSVMCTFFEVSRSGYYDFVKRIGKPEQDVALAKEIEECQNRTDRTYGHRRVWKWLKDRNIERNPKTVLRVMKKYGLLSEIRRRRKWINLGKQVHKYKKLLELIWWNEGMLQATMTDQQKKLFSRYIDAVREHQMTADCLIFQNGFKLGARIMLEVMGE